MKAHKLFKYTRRYTVVSVPTGRVMAFNATSQYKALEQGRSHFDTPVSIIRVS